MIAYTVGYRINMKNSLTGTGIANLIEQHVASVAQPLIQKNATPLRLKSVDGVNSKVAVVMVGFVIDVIATEIFDHMLN